MSSGASQTQLLARLGSPREETYGFMHLDFAVTVPRVELVREAIISVADMELGGDGRGSSSTACRHRMQVAASLTDRASALPCC